MSCIVNVATVMEKRRPTGLMRSGRFAGSFRRDRSPTITLTEDEEIKHFDHFDGRVGQAAFLGLRRTMLFSRVFGYLGGNASSRHPLDHFPGITARQDDNTDLGGHIPLDMCVAAIISGILISMPQHRVEGPHTARTPFASSAMTRKCA
jgi:hypothetical protein